MYHILQRRALHVVLLSWVVCLGVFISGCADKPSEMTKKPISNKQVVKVLVNRGDVNIPSGEMTNLGDIERLQKVLKEAAPAGEEVLYTQDFYRNLTLVFDDGSTRGVSFNQGGGYVFVDQQNGERYVIDGEARSIVQQLVDLAEAK